MVTVVRDNEPVEAAEVRVYKNMNGNSHALEYVASGTTGKNGRIFFPNLPPDLYKVMVVVDNEVVHNYLYSISGNHIEVTVELENNILMIPVRFLSGENGMIQTGYQTTFVVQVGSTLRTQGAVIPSVIENFGWRHIGWRIQGGGNTVFTVKQILEMQLTEDTTFVAVYQLQGGIRPVAGWLVYDLTGGTGELEHDPSMHFPGTVILSTVIPTQGQQLYNGVMTDVVFVGWSSVPTNEILTLNSDLVTTWVTTADIFAGQTSVVYAVWGFVTNGYIVIEVENTRNTYVYNAPGNNYDISNNGPETSGDITVTFPPGTKLDDIVVFLPGLDWRYGIKTDDGTGNIIVTITSPGVFPVNFLTGKTGIVSEGQRITFIVRAGNTLQAQGIVVPTIMADSGWNHVGWVIQGGDGTVFSIAQILAMELMVEKTFVAVYHQSGGIIAPLADGRQLLCIVGFLDNDCRPDEFVTRAEAAAVISRIYFSAFPAGAMNEVDFTDIDCSERYSAYIEFMQQRGIMQGSSNGNLYSEWNITRAEFITMVARFVGLTSHGTTDWFSDIGGHWVEGYVNAIITETPGILLGHQDGEFRPDALITGVEAVTILSRILGKC